MAIDIISLKKESHLKSTWAGSITVSDAINQYRIFLNSSDWRPGMNKLCDLSNFNFKSISTNVLISMSLYVQSVYESHNLSSVKLTAFCPHDL